MKCANVAFSVVPGVGDGDARIEIVFVFDIVAKFLHSCGLDRFFSSLMLLNILQDPL